jgi:hypothetical protein
MSENIKRISVEEAVMLWPKHDLEPIPHNFLFGARGCLIGVLMVDRLGRHGAYEAGRACNWSPFNLAPFLELDRTYVDGLESGFSRPDFFADYPFDRESEAWQLGFADGLAIRQRVLPVTESQTS